MSACAAIQPGATLILGQTYTGKSTLARKLLAARPNTRALWFDPSGSSAVDGLPELTTREECRRFLTGEASRGEWLRVVRFADPDDYGWLASTAEVWRGVIWVLDDGVRLMEVDAVRRMVVRVAISGRHMGDRAGVELWFIGHRPVDVPKSARAAVMAVHTFRQRDPDDVKLLRYWCGAELADKVPALADRKHLSWPAQGAGEDVEQRPRAARRAKRARTTRGKK